MDKMIYATVRQISASWYRIVVREGQDHEAAVKQAMGQVQFYLYDLGLGNEDAKMYLSAAHEAVTQMLDLGNIQN
jgi:hypothetical protein